jgi:hypothetical protein
MNKYEVLFQEILQKTQIGQIVWRQVRKNLNSDLIFNPNLVFRQFEGSFERGGEEYTLLLLEKKYEDPEQDFVFDRYVPELLVVSEGELVATMSDSVIDRASLSRLASLVETRSDKASKLFGPTD